MSAALPREPGDAVLVVDADEGSLGSLTAMLAALGRPVRASRDASSALASIAESPTALVVLSGERAIEVARAIRAQLAHRSPRLLLVTSPDMRRVELVHVDDVVRRPYRAEELLGRARRLLRASGVIAVRRASPAVSAPRRKGAP